MLIAIHITFTTPVGSYNAALTAPRADRKKIVQNKRKSWPKGQGIRPPTWN